MQKSKLYDYLHFLVEPLYNGFPMKNTTVLMEYTLPVSHSKRSEFLTVQEDLYKNMVEFKLPIDTKLTEESGDVELELTFFNVAIDQQQVRKTSKCHIPITPISGWSKLVPDDALAAVDQRIIKLMAITQQILDMQVSYDESKADDISLNGNILSLLANGNAIGTKLDLSSINIPQVNTNKEAIDRLDGGIFVEGSVKKQIADTKAELEQKITESQYDDNALSGRVSVNETAIEKLNGTGEGSVRKQVDDAINDFATKISDDNVINTFKELVDYCATHSADAATMTGDIAKNKEQISALMKLVGTLPEEIDAKTVIDYINKKVEAVDFSDSIATAKREAINAAVSDAKTKANTAESNAKAYADALSTANQKMIEILKDDFNAEISEDEISALFDLEG